MEQIHIPYVKTHSGAVAPCKDKNDEGNAGYDLVAVEPVTIKPFERVLVKTGLKLQIPEGWYGRIAPKSGLAWKKGIDVMAGVIDSNYRGELGVVLINLNGRSWIERLVRSLGNAGAALANQLWGDEEEVRFNAGERVAQIIFERAYSAHLEEVSALSDSVRGAGGYGSTGK